jgi:hypothetical protein
MLCGERRDAPVWNKRGNAHSIAKQVYEYETGESGEKKPRHGDDEWTGASMNPDEEQFWDENLGHFMGDKQRLQSIVSRYLKNARKYLDNVCEGKFP